MFEKDNSKNGLFMEDSPIAQRLKSIIEALGLSDSQFADTCSISRPTLSLLLSGKNKKISDIMLSQIHNAFPAVSILWLLFGEGEMFKSEETSVSHDKNPNENPKIPGLDKEPDEELNLVNVKQLESIIKEVINQAFETSQDDLRTIVRKITEPVALRKVSSITVYYDDSTFETFRPER